MKSTRLLWMALAFVALVLACDVPFIAQEKKATYVESATNPTLVVVDSNATSDAMNATPGATDATPAPGETQTTRRAATSAPRAAPAVYVQSLRVDPPQPRSGPGPVTFYVKFQSTFPNKQTYKWLVKIYRPGENKSFGETAAITSDIAPGVTEIASPNNWHTNPFSCEPFTARVHWFTPNFADPLEFKKPDGVNTPFLDFKVCP